MNYKVDFKTKTMEWKTKYNALVKDFEDTNEKVMTNQKYTHNIEFKNYPTAKRIKINLTDGSITISEYTPNYAAKSFWFNSDVKTPYTTLDNSFTIPQENNVHLALATTGFLAKYSRESSRALIAYFYTTSEFIIQILPLTLDMEVTDTVTEN